MLYCQGIWVAERRSKEPNQDDLRQVSGTKHSQHGLTSGFSSLAVTSLPQSLRHRVRVVRQGLGLPGNERSDPQRQMVLEQVITTRFPSPWPLLTTPLL